MAQTGYTPILIYSSSTAAATPAAGNLTNSTLGSELAINIADGKLFYKDTSNVVQVIGWKVVPTSAGGTGLTTYAAGDLLYYATGTTLSKLAIGANKTILTSNSTAPQWSASLDTTQGGTGITSYAQGDLLYYNTGTTLTALAKNATATRYLSNTGTNNNPAWAQIDLSNGVTGTLSTGNGGTGLTSFYANGILYATSTSALTTSANLIFDGTNMSTTGVILNASNRIMLNQTGGILQVVNATYDTQSTSSSGTFADTGLTATITPSSTSSKILVLVNQTGCGKDTNDTTLQLRLMRDATALARFESAGGWVGAADKNFIGSCSICYVDSPATTSAVTYKSQFAAFSAAANVYCQYNVGAGTSVSTITLMEIAA